MSQKLCLGHPLGARVFCVTNAAALEENENYFASSAATVTGITNGKKFLQNCESNMHSNSSASQKLEKARAMISKKMTQ